MRWPGSAGATHTSHSVVPGRALPLDLDWGWPGRCLGYDISGLQGRCPQDMSRLQQLLEPRLLPAAIKTWTISAM